MSSPPALCSQMKRWNLRNYNKKNSAVEHCIVHFWKQERFLFIDLCNSVCYESNEREILVAISVGATNR